VQDPGSRSSASGYDHIRLEWEQLAEMPYRPVTCKQAYRLIVVRKNRSRERQDGRA
jgi:hypothetical protein